MNLFRRLFSRNLAMSQGFRTHSKAPVYTNWSVRKAVKDGYRANGWVYRAVYLLAKSAASVPWVVYNSDGEQAPEHYLSGVLSRPNPHLSRQDIIELLVSWLELAGNSYLYRVRDGAGRTAELWPVSPDRLRPVVGEALNEWVVGYQLDGKRGIAYEPDQIIHHRLIDPANPVTGISPLEVAGKATDLDNSLRDFNTSTSQSRGVLEGVFTFDRAFSSQDETDALASSIEEKYGKKRGFLVLGNNAKYQRLGITPAEMDFVESRKFNREEICVIFGVPLPLISQERTTYNNYQTAEEILWTLTVLPLLDDIADTFTFRFGDELPDGHRIGFDLSNVQAIRRVALGRSDVAKKLHDLGVPFDRLNRMLRLGIDAYDGWDISYPPQRNPDNAPDVSGENEDGDTRSAPSARVQFRSVSAADHADQIDEAADEWSPEFENLLDEWRADVSAAVEDGKVDGWSRVLDRNRDGWLDVMRDHFLAVGSDFGERVTVGRRDEGDAIEAALDEYLQREAYLLTELSRIKKSTVAAILDQITDAAEAGESTGSIQQRLIDIGVFDPSRALRLARTLTGTAASIGQYINASENGATHKTWHSGGKNVRDEHKARNGERVPMDGRFSRKFGEQKGPRYPLDPHIPPADRVNCKCSMSFDMGDDD